MVEYLCGRVGCGEPATCVLLMAPQDTQAWLVDPNTPPAPDGVPLCRSHADRISVPFGWSLQDDRPAAKPKRKRRKKPAAPAKPDPALDDVAPHKATTPAPRTRKAEPEPPGVDAAPRPGTKPPPRVAGGASSAGEAVVAGGASSAGEAVVAGEAASADTPPLSDGVTEAVDDPTLQLPRITRNHPSSPAEVPMNADATAAAVDESDRRLSVVPGDDDPNKTFDFEDDGQGALWADRAEDERDPDESTPLLKRAFRVVRDD